MGDVEVKDGDYLKYYRLDMIWEHLAKQKTISGKLEFDWLSKIAKLVLVLLHSNAGEETVFSMVRKNKTSVRLVQASVSTPLVPYCL